MASAALVFGPASGPGTRSAGSSLTIQNAAAIKSEKRISLQTTSINSNSRYFAPNARPRSFAFRQYALPTADSLQALAVEWKVNTCA